MSFWRTADILAPSVALGHFFGRLGCFAAGCCWGREAHGVALRWAARFPVGEPGLPGLRRARRAAARRRA